MKILVHQEAAPRITRRALLGGVTVVGAAALAGCKAPGSGTSAKPSSVPTVDASGPMESSLNIYSWGDYDAPGNIKAFRSDNNLKLQFDTFASNEEMIAKLVASKGASGYDMVVPTGNFVPQMVENGLLAKLHLDLIPNFSNMLPEYRDRSWDPNNEFVICKDWGTTGFVYDTTKIQRDLTSWADFIDAATHEAKNSTSVLDDPFEFATIYLASHGYDLNTTDASQLKEAEDFLVGTLAKSIRNFSSDPSQNLVQSDFALMQMYNGDCRWAIDGSKEPDKWKFVYPTPTANLWVDNWAITAGCEHPVAAHAWINYMLDPEISWKEMKWNGYPTGIAGQEQQARDSKLWLIDLVFPPAEVVDRLTPQELTSAQQTLVDILSKAKAAAAS